MAVLAAVCLPCPRGECPAALAECPAAPHRRVCPPCLKVVCLADPAAPEKAALAVPAVREVPVVRLAEHPVWVDLPSGGEAAPITAVRSVTTISL